MSKQNFIILLFGILLFVALLILLFGYNEVLYSIWNTPVIHPYFADIRTITGVNNSIAQGLDPFIANPGDPWGRVMNYPRVWQYIAEFLELKQSHGIYLGLIFLLFFVVGFLIFALKVELSKTMVFVLLVAFFSPASILGMERANVDIFIFFLLSLALLYISKPVIFAIIITIASILKLYPIFALIGLIRYQKWYFIKLFIGFLFIFICYLALTIDDIILIKDNIPNPTGMAYGASVIWMQVDSRLGVNLGLLTKLITYSYIIGLIVYIFITSKRYNNIISNKRYIDSFRIGCMIFLANFVLTSSWDYRLIFLIFCLPQLVIWSTSEKERLIRVLSLLSLIFILWTMWFLNVRRFHIEIAWIVDELSNWILFSSLLFLFVATLPNWIMNLTHIFDKKYDKVEG